MDDGNGASDVVVEGPSVVTDTQDSVSRDANAGSVADIDIKADKKLSQVSRSDKRKESNMDAISDGKDEASQSVYVVDDRLSLPTLSMSEAETETILSGKNKGNGNNNANNQSFITMSSSEKDDMLTDEELEEMEDMSRGRGRTQSFHPSQNDENGEQKRIIMTGNAPLTKKALDIVSNLENIQKPTDNPSVTASPALLGQNAGGPNGLFRIGSGDDLMEEKLAQLQEEDSRKQRLSLMTSNATTATSSSSSATAPNATPQKKASRHHKSGSEMKTSTIKDMLADSDFDEFFKILLIGDSGTGKTSLLHRITDNHFKSHTVATAGVDSKLKFVTVDNLKIKLQIWDTAGQERFRVITKSYYKGVHAICLVFDLTDMESFTHVSSWMESIRSVLKSNNTNNVPILLVGNKSDCTAQQRKVSKEAAIKKAEESGLAYFETSARTGQNVVELLESASRMILGNKAQGKQDGTSQSPSLAPSSPNLKSDASTSSATIDEKKKSKQGMKNGKGCCVM